MDWNNYPCDKCTEGIETCKDCIQYGDCNHVNQCICCKCRECELWEFEQALKNKEESK